jgi:hypothetical protein
VDSRFCSYCSARLPYLLGEDHVAHEAQTVTLGDFPGPMDFGHEQGPPYRLPRRSPAFYYVLLAGLFAGAFVLTSLIARTMVDRTEPSTPDAPEANVPPDARMQALRRELDADGYKNVSFRLDGDTLIVWGTVSSEFDRANVRWVAFRVAGIVSIVDHIQVHDTMAEP